MKKLMPYLAGVLFALFALAVFAVVLSLSYRALGYIFPGDLFDQGIGLVLFDLAAIVWFVTFTYRSESTMQYVFAALGFLVGLVGMIGLVAIEVGISSGMLVASEMIKPLVYIFIAVAVAHVVLVYARHAAGPEVTAKISLGVEKAKIHDEGMRQAEEHLEQARVQLGDSIRARLVEDVLREMNIEVIDGKATTVSVMQEQQKQENFLSHLRWPWAKGGRRYNAGVSAVVGSSQVATPTPGPVQGDAGPDSTARNNGHA